ncbi:MAG: TIGR04282 family arsenosugar biosynthesis glycosyltransferase [candidate division KSB1 bacterium]|nr:TIGR04282 family arsenosugar biosynthesis glycosyltransferase [candidate division KSB1 bacterium]MDZ7364389.1 TIGR04282 family arsenosugar biosynthesis glycosyltransferase [candidate division KSB1 bacterium]MDZ7402761.1 TIGR04282 family arsenosugar biosynthesis glycosyltransferase [candidate division KSB1 bacterium]
MPTDSALLIFVKYPEPGKVKTRLAAAVGAEIAAQLYQEFIRCTFDIAMQIEVAAQFVTFTPIDKAKELRKLFPGPWQWFAQAESTDLGMRIHRAVQHVQQQGYSHVLTIGTDSPSLPAEYLKQAATALSTHDVVLGPATDGGYYLIGLKSAPEKLFTGIEWSTERVLQQTLNRAEQLRMSVHQLPVWYDVDDLTTLQRFCREANLPPALLQKVKSYLCK